MFKRFKAILQGGSGKTQSGNRNWRAMIPNLANGESGDLEDLQKLPFDYIKYASEGEVEGNLLRQDVAKDDEGEPPLYRSIDESITGRVWLPGDIIDGRLLVKEHQTALLGPSYVVEHLPWQRTLRLVFPLKTAYAEPTTWAAVSQNIAELADLGVHPNLVSVLYQDFICERPVIVTDFVEGRSLRALIEEQRGGVWQQVKEAVAQGEQDISASLSAVLGRILDVFWQANGVLDGLHRLHMFHQCLCPDVLWIKPNGTLCLDQLYAYRPWNGLKDSDIKAVSADKRLPDEAVKSLPGVVAASPLYMSPERWSKGGMDTAAGNIYALGAIMYEYICGRPPLLPLECHSGAAWASLKARVLFEDPAPLTQWCPEIPADLSDLIMSMLAKKPARRPCAAGIADRLKTLYDNFAPHAFRRPYMELQSARAEDLNNKGLLAADKFDSASDEAGEDEAWECWKEACHIDPDCVESQVNQTLWGWIHGYLSWGEVSRRMDKWSLQGPAAVGTARALLWLCLHAGKVERATAVAQFLADKDNGWAQSLFGLMLAEGGSLHQAQTCLEKSISLRPNCWETYYNMGVCLNRLGQKTLARRFFKQAVELGGHPTARVGLALFTAAQGEPGYLEEAIEQLDAAQQVAPHSAWVNYHLGAYFGSMGLAVPGFDSAPTDLGQSYRYLWDAYERSTGFYKASVALSQVCRRAGRPVPDFDLAAEVNVADEMRRLGPTWNVNQVQTLSGHKEAVNAITMSRDGRFIVSAGHDDSILLWDSVRGDVHALLRGHAAPVRAVVISADSRLVVSASDDGTIKMWQSSNGACVRTLKGHQGAVLSLALNGAGDLLISGGEDRTIRLWNMYSGDQVGQLNGHNSGVNALVISPDGLTAVSAGGDHRINIWNLGQGTLTMSLFSDLAEFPEQLDNCYDGVHGVDGVPFGNVHEEIYSLSLDASAEWLLSGGSGQSLKLWNLRTGDIVRELAGHENEVRAVAITPDGKLAISGGWDRVLRLWNVSTGECLRAVPAHEHQITCVYACADGRFGLSGSLDRTIKMWEWKDELLPFTLGEPPLIWADSERLYLMMAADALSEGSLNEASGAIEAGRYGEAYTLLRKVQKLPGKANDPAVESLLAQCAEYGQKESVLGARPKSVLEGHSSWVLRAAWSVDGSILASGGLDGRIALWDSASGELLMWLEGHGREISSLDFSNDNSSLISASYDCTLRVWDLNVGEASAVLRGHQSEVTCGIISRHLPMILSTGMDGQGLVWNAQTGKVMRELNGHKGVAFAIALAMSDRLAASGGADKRVILWEIPSGKILAELKGHVKSITTLSFSTDFNCLLSGAEDGKVAVWNIANNKLMCYLCGHYDAVRCVHWSPNSMTAVSCGDDGMICLWDVPYPEDIPEGSVPELSPVCCLGGHKGPVRWVRFSPDGRNLVSCGNDGTVRVWSVDYELSFAL